MPPKLRFPDFGIGMILSSDHWLGFFSFTSASLQKSNTMSSQVASFQNFRRWDIVFTTAFSFYQIKLSSVIPQPGGPGQDIEDGKLEFQQTDGDLMPQELVDILVEETEYQNDVVFDMVEPDELN